MMTVVVLIVRCLKDHLVEAVFMADDIEAVFMAEAITGGGWIFVLGPTVLVRELVWRGPA